MTTAVRDAPTSRIARTNAICERPGTIAPTRANAHRPPKSPRRRGARGHRDEVAATRKPSAAADEGASLGVLVAPEPDADRDGESAEEDAGKRGEKDGVHS